MCDRQSEGCVNACCVKSNCGIFHNLYVINNNKKKPVLYDPSSTTPTNYIQTDNLVLVKTGAAASGSGCNNTNAYEWKKFPNVDALNNITNNNIEVIDNSFNIGISNFKYIESVQYITGNFLIVTLKIITNFNNTTSNLTVGQALHIFNIDNIDATNYVYIIDQVIDAQTVRVTIPAGATISITLNQVVPTPDGYSCVVIPKNEINVNGIYIRSYDPTTYGVFDYYLNVDPNIDSWICSSNFVTQGLNIANAFNTFSDINLKTNIESIPNNKSLEIVNKLNPVYYHWDVENHKEKNFTEKKQIGFIAQQVEPLIPEAVTKDDKYLSVDYSKLTAVLVGSIQELTEEIRKLKEEVALLKS